jgi:rSAM/selenodomain-associated transferase 1
VAGGSRTTIFTKRPEPGAAKTRLCPPLSAAHAAELAQAMLDDTVSKCLGARELDVGACVAPLCGETGRSGETGDRGGPDDSIAWFRARHPSLTRVTRQLGDGLGARLARHFEDELAHERGPLVVIGSDAPHVPVERIVQAHAALARGADLVIGPDEGGGYYLVGLARSVPELFTRVPMSTGVMLSRTLDLAREIGLETALLAPDYDIDAPGDALRLLSELRSGARERTRTPRTSDVLERLAADLGLEVKGRA